MNNPAILQDLPRFDMVRPCGDCPFRRDTPCQLEGDLPETVMEGLIFNGDGFMCHKTVAYDDPATYAGGRPTANDQHCAGAMIFLEKVREPNKMMLRALARGTFDPERLDMAAPVVDTAREFLRGQGRAV